MPGRNQKGALNGGIRKYELSDKDTPQKRQLPPIIQLNSSYVHGRHRLKSHIQLPVKTFPIPQCSLI